jgi:hypothetical protein
MSAKSKAPSWQAFLDTIIPDPKKQALLQEMIAWALCGLVERPPMCVYLKADRPRLIHIVGMGLGKSTVAKLLIRWYQENSTPFVIIASESDTPEAINAKLSKLKDFKRFIILVTRRPIPGLDPWQTITVSGGIDAAPPRKKSLQVPDRSSTGDRSPSGRSGNRHGKLPSSGAKGSRPGKDQR